MARRKRKEPVVVLVVFLVIQIGLMVAFALRGNFEALQERYDWKQLAIIASILFVIYILYVELRGKRQLQVIVEEKVKTHTLVDGLPQPVMVLDDQNVVVTANDAACRALSIDPVSTVGMKLGQAFDDGTTARLSSGAPGRIEGATREGKPLRISITPLRGDAGKLLILAPQAPEAAPAPAAPPPKSPPVWEALLRLEPCLDRLDDETRRALADVFIQARRLLLGPGELEAIPARAPKEPANLEALAREAAGKTGLIARGRGIALEIKAEGDSSAPVDAELFRRILEEVLVNAFTYSPESGRVVVEVIPEEGDVLLRVTDSGVGIPPDELSKVFDPGFVGANQGPTGAGGKGMGLALARRGAEAHGGSIWVESRPGQGTRISLSIPRR